MNPINICFDIIDNNAIAHPQKWDNYSGLNFKDQFSQIHDSNPKRLKQLFKRTESNLGRSARLKHQTRLRFILFFQGQEKCRAIQTDSPAHQRGDSQQEFWYDCPVSLSISLYDYLCMTAGLSNCHLRHSTILRRPWKALWPCLW